MGAKKMVSKAGEDTVGRSIGPTLGSTSGQREHSSGQPGSRPITEALLRIVNSPVSNPPPCRTYADRIAQTLILRAIDGDLPTTKEITDRIEGRVGERPVERNLGPVDIRVVYEPPLKPAALADTRPQPGEELERTILRNELN
jgi:hypothetical protein